jgi:predicted RNA binding protein YcfA (HicA-like mRNA interferase family)/predicted RNase H-like HicB family nuclease
MRCVTAAVTKEDDGYVAPCLDVEVASQGKSVEEALDNLREALALDLEDAAEPCGRLRSSLLSRSLMPSGPEVVAALRRAGFQPVSQRGRHRKRTGHGGWTVIVPLPADLAPGTLASVLRQAGITRDPFDRLMGASERGGRRDAPCKAPWRRQAHRGAILGLDRAKRVQNGVSPTARGGRPRVGGQRARWRRRRWFGRGTAHP